MWHAREPHPLRRHRVTQTRATSARFSPPSELSSGTTWEVNKEDGGKALPSLMWRGSWAGVGGRKRRWVRDGGRTTTDGRTMTPGFDFNLRHPPDSDFNQRHPTSDFNRWCPSSNFNPAMPPHLISTGAELVGVVRTLDL
jgi:hypothetical protein